VSDPLNFVIICPATTPKRVVLYCTNILKMRSDLAIAQNGLCHLGKGLNAIANAISLHLPQN
jgi:hypothetical protein